MGSFMSYRQPPGYASYQQEYEVPEEEDDTCELQLPSPLELAAQVCRSFQNPDTAPECKQGLL